MLNTVTLFNCNGKLLDFENPIIMGILNANDDSFFAKSRVAGVEEAINLAGNMFDQGALIVDIGGISSRPGAKVVSESEEIDRLMPYLEKFCNTFPDKFFSVDTFRANVAQLAYDSGIHIINDISGGKFDDKMLQVIGTLKIPYVLMHNGSDFENMHLKVDSKDPVLEIFDYFSHKIMELNNYGIYDIFLDPGFGFGKKQVDNYAILKNLEFFKILHLPILTGISRKSMIYKKLDTTIEESLNGTTALHMYALMQGAKVLRVHDVKEAKQVCDLFEYLSNSDTN